MHLWCSWRVQDWITYVIIYGQKLKEMWETITKHNEHVHVLNASQTRTSKKRNTNQTNNSYLMFIETLLQYIYTELTSPEYY